MEKTIKFKFDQDLKKGYYSSKYFLNSKKILKNNPNSQNVTLKFSHFNNEAVVCGIDEIVQLIKFVVDKKALKEIEVFGKKDGEIAKKGEPILLIKGNYSYFSYLENIIDGILSRRSSIATNCKKTIDLIGSERMIFMADRSDDYTIQPYDGYAAYCGGVKKFVTKKQIEFIKNDPEVKYLGTIPHALIQQHQGDLVKTLKNYQKVFKNEQLTALIDYHNDCLGEIEKLKQANIYPDFVRIDTSSSLIDKSLQKRAKKSKNEHLFYGVNAFLIQNVRQKLNEVGMFDTKIIISSGLTAEKIKELEQKKVPVDIYGIGRSLLKINLNISADLIKIGEKYEAKFGRKQNIEKYLPNLIKYI